MHTSKIQQFKDLCRWSFQISKRYLLFYVFPRWKTGKIIQ